MQANAIRHQNLNLDGSKPDSIVNVSAGITANPNETGSTNTAVLRFSAPAVVVGNGASETTTAADGTAVTITGSGHWMLEFGGATEAANLGLALGVGVNLAAGAITADPSYATPGVIWALPSITTDLSSTPFLFKTGLYVIKGGSLVVQFLATNDAAGAPTLTTSVTAFFYRLTRRQAIRGRS